MTHDIDFLNELESQLLLVASRQDVERAKRARRVARRPRSLLVLAAAVVALFGATWINRSSSTPRATPLAATISVHTSGPQDPNSVVRFGFSTGSSIRFATCSTVSCSRNAAGDFGISPSRRICEMTGHEHSSRWKCSPARATKGAP